MNFHVADLYFENSVVLEKREFKQTNTPPVSEFLNNAEALRSKSKELARKKFP